jgi:hypothetical protein
VYGTLIYVPISCILEEKGSHHLSMRESTPNSNFFRIQGQFLEDIGMSSTPYPTLLAVYIVTKAKTCFIPKGNIILYGHSIFLSECIKPLTIT